MTPPYVKSEASKATRENFEREFLNADTPHDKWKVVQKMLDVIDDKEEINFYLKNTD